jgi:hypothetical protein
MKTPVVTMQEYRDANGNSIIITSVNGVATTEIPAGYTLYTPPANTAPTTTQAAIQTVNSRSYRPSGDNEGPEPQPDQPAPDYRNMNDDEFFSYMAEQNSFGAKAGNAAGLAIATMIGGPVGLLVSALMRNDKNNQMADAAGYHKSLFTAMNADAIAKHFYEQGKADAIKDTVAKAKNVDVNPRGTHGEVNTGGIKVRVLGDDSSSLRFKMKKRK